MLHDVGQEGEVILGEEWSDRASFEQVIEEYIRPYVSGGMKALEIGIGGGRVAKRVYLMVKELHAVDISVEMIKKAKNNLNEATNIK